MPALRISRHRCPKQIDPTRDSHALKPENSADVVFVHLEHKKCKRTTWKTRLAGSDNPPTPFLYRIICATAQISFPSLPYMCIRLQSLINQLIMAECVIKEGHLSVGHIVDEECDFCEPIENHGNARQLSLH